MVSPDNFHYNPLQDSYESRNSRSEPFYDDGSASSDKSPQSDEAGGAQGDRFGPPEDEEHVDESGEEGELDEEEGEAHGGVQKVVASDYGRYSKVSLYTGLALASYIYSLDGSTTSYYLAFATSAFGEHRLVGAIQVVQSIIIAVGKPIIAKLSDVSSRGNAYLVVLIFYVCGYIVIASARNVESIAGGIVLYSIGYTGLHLLTQILLADLTPLSHRALFSSLVSAPFLVNAFIGAKIASSVVEGVGWRWGYAMFTILMPLSLCPLIGTLLYAESRAQNAHRRYSSIYASPSRPTSIHISSRSRSPSSFSSPVSPSSSLQNSQHGHHARLSSSSALLRPHSRVLTKGEAKRRKVWRFAEKLDLVGLTLLGGAIAMILLPLTLASKNSQSARKSWTSGPVVPLFLLGILSFGAFAFWETRYARYPVLTAKFIRNESAMYASLIGLFDFASFYLTFTYLYSWVLVVKPWSLVHANYFMQTQMLSLTVFGIVAGISMRYLHRYKYVLIGGLLIRLVGVALMHYSRSPAASAFALILSQVLQGGGGGFAAAASQVGAQASVSRTGVAMVTAIVHLATEVGGAFGGALAGMIWSHTMPANLTKYLPSLSESERNQLFGSITKAASYPLGDPIREGVIAAYGDTMGVMVHAATVLSIIPIALALGMPNWYLGSRQNALEPSESS